MSIEYGLTEGETHEYMEDREEFKRVWGKFLVMVIALDDGADSIWSFRQSMELAKNGVSHE